ncbi:MAG: PrgI family protein [Candidatus ainarchaeum sp.]|nr:PrgI family protein [Candidatus ainarchaeum sp.]
MSYEIPKNLKYEEKLIFNLSLQQTIWLAIFIIPSAIIILKSPLPFEINIIIAILLTIIGLGFAFLNLKEYILTIYKYFSQPRQLGYLSKKMANFIEVKEIKENIILLNNNSTKAIIQIQPINFHILSTRQQEAIISAYKDFLNSLDFPIQIVMRTVNLSLEDYLNKLEQNINTPKNIHLKKQFDDFKTFLLNYIENNAIKNRLFYIVIPSNEKNIDDSINQLNIRTTLCQDKLKNCNLTTKRLNTQELTTMLSSYFEGFIENGIEYQSILTILQKGEN